MALLLEYSLNSSNIEKFICIMKTMSYMQQITIMKIYSALGVDKEKQGLKKCVEEAVTNPGKKCLLSR